MSILTILGLSLSRSDTFSEGNTKYNNNTATVLSLPMVDTSFSLYNAKLYEQQSKMFLTFWKNLGNQSYVKEYNKSFPYSIEYFIKIFNFFGYGDSLDQIIINLAHSCEIDMTFLSTLKKKTLDLCSAISHLISHNIKEMIKYPGMSFLRNSKEFIEMVDRLNLCKIGDL
ncbi:hypothetical protein HZS_7719, partial [Henneguya salminicola]